MDYRAKKNKELMTKMHKDLRCKNCIWSDQRIVFTDRFYDLRTGLDEEDDFCFCRGFAPKNHYDDGITKTVWQEVRVNYDWCYRFLDRQGRTVQDLLSIDPSGFIQETEELLWEEQK